MESERLQQDMEKKDIWQISKLNITANTLIIGK